MYVLICSDNKESGTSTYLNCTIYSRSSWLICPVAHIMTDFPETARQIQSSFKCNGQRNVLVFLGVGLLEGLGGEDAITIVREPFGGTQNHL